MKLYAEVISDRASRPARKGGDVRLKVRFTWHSIPTFNVSYSEDGLVVEELDQYGIVSKTHYYPEQ